MNFAILDESHTWTELGSLTDLSFGGDVVESEPIITPGPASWSVSITPSNPFALGAFGLATERKPRFAFHFEMPPEPYPRPAHPRKGGYGRRRGRWVRVQGKAYRAACRDWQRRVKAWERNGGMLQRFIYLPSATIERIEKP